MGWAPAARYVLSGRHGFDCHVELFLIIQQKCTRLSEKQGPTVRLDGDKCGALRFAAPPCTKAAVRREQYRVAQQNVTHRVQ